MPDHKIQSRDISKLDSKAKEESNIGMNISLVPVPKMLGKIKSEWNSKTMLVSFKLETDENILATKAKYSMDKYKTDICVANLLQTVRSECCIYSD
jgi:phosphopantothenate-cysteine ligase